jgi:hypothetical protein
MILKNLLLLIIGCVFAASEALKKTEEAGQISKSEAPLTRAGAFSGSGLHNETTVQDPSPLGSPSYFLPSGSVPGT